MDRQQFKKLYFFHGKDSRFSPPNIRIKAYLIGQVPIKTIDQKLCFAIQHIGERKKYGVLPLPPPPINKLIVLHTFVVLHCTHHIKLACLIKGGGGKTVQMLKNNLVIMPSKLILYKRGSISIYNGVYIVCSYNTPQ